jgi:polyphosphate kinase
MAKSSIFQNREISWLNFNSRVLQEALDDDTPLIEKIRFMGIYSNNLDEFFRVRVATLRRIEQLESRNAAPTKHELVKTIKEINQFDKKKQKEFVGIFNGLIEQLADSGIYMLSDQNLTPEQGNFVKRYFHEHVRPRLFPIMFTNLQSLSLIDSSLYLAVILNSDKLKEVEQYALIEVPSGMLPRFLVLPEVNGKKYFILLDDIIRYCLHEIFSVFDYSGFQAFAIKITRDAELDIDNDISKSFLEIMSESVKQRGSGLAVRFTYDRQMPETLLKKLLEKFGLKKSDSIIPSGKYHKFRDFISFPNFGCKHLEFPILAPVNHPDLSSEHSMLKRIKQKDLLIHYPYQSFQHLIDLLREASMDPNVRAIKMTLYRLASESSIVNALINGVRNGKEVTVFLELQARFNEEANIYWSERMQQEGVRVIQSMPGFKVHSKLLLIRRKEEKNKNVYYCGIGTGNFNETTARIYTDTTLFTANKAIADEVNTVFHLFDSKYSTPRFKNLLVSPYTMRSGFTRLIENEIKNAKQGKEAWMVLKLNSLADEKIIRKLYSASQAGVKIKLIIRGICMLIPGIKSLSENIEAISIVGRYLEHSRVYVFCNGGNPKFYLSSADWMVRNFDFRIEVATPVYDNSLQKELMKILNLQMADNSKARIISGDSVNEYVDREPEDVKIDSQIEIHELFKHIHPIQKPKKQENKSSLLGSQNTKRNR